MYFQAMLPHRSDETSGLRLARTIVKVQGGNTRSNNVEAAVIADISFTVILILRRHIAGPTLLVDEGWRLILRSVRAEDARAQFACSVLDSLSGERRRSPAAHVDVAPSNSGSAPRALTHSLWETSARRGTDVVLPCLVHATPPPTITTDHNGSQTCHSSSVVSQRRMLTVDVRKQTTGLHTGGARTHDHRKTVAGLVNFISESVRTRASGVRGSSAPLRPRRPPYALLMHDTLAGEYLHTQSSGRSVKSVAPKLESLGATLFTTEQIPSTVPALCHVTTTAPQSVNPRYHHHIGNNSRNDPYCAYAKHLRFDTLALR
ncbi:hypothetical protein EVAR_341_1 [Eumeta japonica]|uniref:Uncharacterized protein n=1 Tax=Eumeta variegata TaxID=151549 RepID=A0A4C1S9W1_EUMVA|nr:hypothetical protein EVAR_341_1 [Eumeta japonica]